MLKVLNHKTTKIPLIILFFGMHTGCVCAQTAIFFNEPVSKKCGTINFMFFHHQKKTEISYKGGPAKLNLFKLRRKPSVTKDTFVYTHIVVYKYDTDLYIKLFTINFSLIQMHYLWINQTRHTFLPVRTHFETSFTCDTFL